jgi:pimeloyl-ACP methyl ester carboxylesterase
MSDRNDFRELTDAQNGRRQAHRRSTTDVLEIGYEEHGPTNGPAVILLHGFPYDVRAYDEVAPALAADGCRVLVPYLRGYGPTRFRSPATPRSGEQAALGADLLAFMDSLEIESAILAGHDWGGRAACVVAALWPARCRGLVSLGGYNILDIVSAREPQPPEIEHRFWYQYYFHGERGRAGLDRYRADFCRLLWRLWSPTWAFDDATFAATAPSFDNPDFVDVVIHSYRHGFGLAPGDPAYEAMEARLAERPPITVPTVVLLGADDGVRPHSLANTSRFSGPVEVLMVAHAGHNLPQEQPAAFADAVRSLP